MLNKKIKIVFLVCVLTLTLFTAFTQSNAETIIRCASAFQPENILCKAGEHFKEIVESQSKGDIKVQLFLGGAMGSEEENCEAVKIGAVDMQVNGAISVRLYAPKYYFIDSHFVIRDWNNLNALWNGKLGQKIKDTVAKKGNMIDLGLIYRGLRNFTSNKPIYTPEDVKGLKLRLPNVPTWVATWKAAGALPVPIALTELFSSLQLGVADSSEGPLSQIQSFHLDEVQKYLDMTGHMVSSGQFTMNKDFFENLSEKDQQIVLEAGKEASEWATNEILENETQILIDLQKKGMVVVIPDKKAFFEKAKPVVEKLFKTEWPVTTWEEVLSYQ